MRENQELTDLMIHVLDGNKKEFLKLKPDLVIVHGDTTASFAASLAAFYLKIPVAHVEAGLRTKDIYSPFPEGMNRNLTSKIALFHFAPTIESSKNLVDEGIDRSKVIITSKTVVDSIQLALKTIDEDNELKNKIIRDLESTFKYNTSKAIVLITCHRRENFGQGLENICLAIARLAENFDEIKFILLVHLNPNVQTTVKKLLSDRKNIFLTSPIDYFPFCYLLSKCLFVLTDSGRLQEEAVSFGIPCLAMRENSERPEGIVSGLIKLVGTDENLIYDEAAKLLAKKNQFEARTPSNVYGDGNACKRIVEFLEQNIKAV